MKPRYIPITETELEIWQMKIIKTRFFFVVDNPTKKYFKNSERAVKLEQKITNFWIFSTRLQLTNNLYFVMKVKEAR